MKLHKFYKLKQKLELCWRLILICKIGTGTVKQINRDIISSIIKIHILFDDNNAWPKKLILISLQNNSFGWQQKKFKYMSAPNLQKLPHQLSKEPNFH